MSPRGRKRLLKTFTSRMQSFLGSIRKGKGEGKTYETLKGNSEEMKIGRGPNKHLVEKRGQRVERAAKAERELIDYLKRMRSTTKNFSLVQVHGEVMKKTIGVQEYFERPRINDLISYITSAGSLTQGGKKFTKRDIEICKKFIKNPVNKNITVKKLAQARDEISGLLNNNTHARNMFNTSIIVLGINADGRLRLAIVDSM
ncbi:MAG: hypothetical protein AABW59_00485 [archaeon]